MRSLRGSLQDVALGNDADTVAVLAPHRRADSTLAHGRRGRGERRGRLLGQGIGGHDLSEADVSHASLPFTSSGRRFYSGRDFSAPAPDLFAPGVVYMHMPRPAGKLLAAAGLG